MMLSFGHKRLDQFLLGLILFVNARLLMLLVLPADNLTIYGDYQYFFDLGRLYFDLGYLPFVDYWSEYPPLFPYFNLIVYAIGGGLFKNYVVALGLVLLLFEAGILVLLYLIVTSLDRDTEAVQVSWVYALLYVPAFFWLRQNDSMVAFLFLLALLTLLHGRLAVTGLLIGVGTMLKLFPIMLLVTVWWMYGWRAALKSGLVVLLVIGLILGPFFFVSPDYTLAFVKVQLGRSSWQTVWALLDGNLINTGNVGRLEKHFDPTTAMEGLHNPPRVPSWLTLIPFVGVGWFVATRPITKHKENAVIITAFIVTLFFLWAKGWSPQWQIFLFPLLLLSLPLGRAVIFVLALSWISLVEWPIILSRGLVELLPLTIIARTLVLILLAWELYRQMTKDSFAVSGTS